jgi:hypothetical protein
MNSNQKILVLLVGLIISMYYWVTVGNGIEKIISMLVMVVLSYLLGREHSNKINIANNINVQTNIK